VKAFANWIRGMPMLARWITVAALFAGAVVGVVAGIIVATAFRIRRHIVSFRINHFQGHQRR
jgi:hypothetical protein